VYIERKDFAAEPTKKFFGMGVGRTVLLKYAAPVTCTDFKTDATGKVTEVFVELIPAQAKLPKGKLHWVSAEQNVKVELRLYDVLFAETLPGQNPDVDYDNFDWLNELNPDSEQVVFGYADKSLLAAKVGTAFQMERVGYFIVDEDSAGDKLVLNRTCGLKEKLKNKAKK
jgi:glutaminyl-tRNA synthetase